MSAFRSAWVGLQDVCVCVCVLGNRSNKCLPFHVILARTKQSQNVKKSMRTSTHDHHLKKFNQVSGNAHLSNDRDRDCFLLRDESYAIVEGSFFGKKARSRNVVVVVLWLLCDTFLSQ
jgi:hypothetical protein